MDIKPKPGTREYVKWIAKMYIERCVKEFGLPIDQAVVKGTVGMDKNVKDIIECVAYEMMLEE